MPKDKKQQQIDPFVAKPQTVKAPAPLPKIELGIEAITKKNMGFLTTTLTILGLKFTVAKTVKAIDF